MKKEISRLAQEHIKAYSSEAFASLAEDVLILLFIWVLSFMYYDSAIIKMFVIPVSVFIVVWECICRYRIIMLIMIDRISNDIVTVTVKPEKTKAQLPFLSYKGTDKVSIFYPRDMGVHKYKLYYTDENGKRKYVRVIMSIRKNCTANDHFIGNPRFEKIEIQYFKRSKVLTAINIPKQAKATKDDEMIVRRFNHTI